MKFKIRYNRWVLQKKPQTMANVCMLYNIHHSEIDCEVIVYDDAIVYDCAIVYVIL